MIIVVVLMMFSMVMMIVTTMVGDYDDDVPVVVMGFWSFGSWPIVFQFMKGQFRAQREEGRF